MTDSKFIFEQNKEIPDLQEASLYLAGLTSIAVALFAGLHLYSALGVGLTVYLFSRLLLQMNRTLPVLEIMLTMAAFQWVVGPIIDYQTETTHYKYFMHVEEAEYMKIVVPSLFVFTIFTLFRTKNLVINLSHVSDFSKENPNLPYLLIGSGLFFDFSRSMAPTTLQFVFFLLGNFKFIGLIMLLFSESKKKWLILAVAMIITFLSSVKNALFHDFILWSILLFCVVSIVIQLKLYQKIVLFIIGLLGIIIIQSIKQDFRKQLWSGEYQGNRLELFYQMSREKSVSSELSDDESVNILNARLNQGWIISTVIDRYKTMPFEGGSTVNEAIKSSLIPRFLSPNKTGSRGNDSFQLLTGLELLPGTAMGTSLMGEFYGNYGLRGAMIAFAIWGLFLNLVFRKVSKLQELVPTIMLFLPILFLQVIKAESNMMTVLNHIIKASILVTIVIVMGRKGFNLTF